MVSTLILWFLIIISVELLLTTSAYSLVSCTFSLILTVAAYVVTIGFELLGVSIIIAFSSSYLVYLLVSLYLNLLFTPMSINPQLRPYVIGALAICILYVASYYSTWYVGRFDTVIIRNDIVRELYTDSSSITILIHLLFFKIYVLLFIMLNVYIFITLAVVLSWLGVIIFSMTRFWKKKKIGTNVHHKRVWRRKSTSIVM